MIHEFAVDPKALAGWQNFRYVTEKFGVSHGRLISKFPRKWAKMVLKACDACMPVEKKKIVEALNSIGRKLLPTDRTYDGNVDWITNALASHFEEGAFQAIISVKDNVPKGNVLDVEDLSDGNEKWAVPRARVVRRIAKDMSDAVEMLLRCSSEVVFVDQHFSCGERHGKPLTEFVKAAQSGTPLKRLEYHIGANEKGTQEWFQERLDKQRHFLNLQNGVELVFIRWKMIEGGDNLHPRFVLTERGGIRFDYGLDEGSEGQTTDVECLDEEIYSSKWNQFHIDSKYFELADAWIVSAEKVMRAQWNGVQLIKQNA